MIFIVSHLDPVLRRQYWNTWYSKNKHKLKVLYVKKAKLQRKERAKWFLDLKKQFQCISCGENHPACLDFHHVDPTNKEGHVSAMLTTYPKGKILEEVKKCTVLCSNCHRKLHFEEREKMGLS